MRAYTTFLRAVLSESPCLFHDKATFELLYQEQCKDPQTPFSIVDFNRNYSKTSPSGGLPADFWGHALGGAITRHDQPGWLNKGTLLWSGIIAGSQLLDATRYVFPLARQHKAASELAVVFRMLCIEAEVEWDGEKRQYSLVRCEPRTGRYHQIRRHLRFIGCPIVGDPEYGNGWDNRAFKERFKVERTLLCASHLAFPDREQQKMVRVNTKPDADYRPRSIWRGRSVEEL